MENFDAEICMDEAGRLALIELPFNAREAFCRPKGPVFVTGTINNISYRSKLLSRGGGKFVMIVDKAMQKRLGFDGKSMQAHVAMASDDEDGPRAGIREPELMTCGMDTLTAIKTRRSIRKFTPEPVSQKIIDTILCAGLYAPTAKDKRPCHFVIIKDKALLSELAQAQANAAMLSGAAFAVAICGDKTREGMREFMYADCAAAAQNILLSLHALGLGGVWCGVAANSDWQKLLIHRLALPPKVEPAAVIAAGWPAEEKETPARWDPAQLHYDRW